MKKMLKKLGQVSGAAFVLILCIACLKTPSEVWAAETSGTCGENISWEYDEATKTLNISGEGKMMDYYDFNIGVNKEPRNPWKESGINDEVKEVVIEEGVTHIGWSAFIFFTQLKEITIPSSVTSIGECVFFRCYDLEEIVIPDSVTSIHDRAFDESGLKKASLPCRFMTEVSSQEFFSARGVDFSFSHPNRGNCVQEGYCDCGEYSGFDYTRHEETELRNAAEATCTETGYTGDTCCKDCGFVFAAGEAIEAKGHAYTSAVTKEPTIKEDGVLTYTCVNCNVTYTEVIEKLPDPAKGVVAEVTYATHWGNGGQIEILLENTGAVLNNGWGTELTINLTGKMAGTWGDGFVTFYENGHIVIKNQDWVKSFETGIKKSVWLQFDGILPVEASNVVAK